MRVMWSPLSAAGFISCFLLLLIASVADGRAAISLQKPLRPVVHRPGQFNLTVFKTGFSASPVTIIVEVCYASHIETELLSINPFVLYVLLVVGTIITGRIAAKRQTAGNKFTQRPKITIFAPQGLLVAPIQVKFGTACKFRTMLVRGSAWPCEISPQSVHGVGTRPPKSKISTFWQSCHSGANPLADFYRCYGLLRAQLP